MRKLLARWLNATADSIERAFSPNVVSVEEWADSYSKLGTPDEIIAAHVLQSIAKDFHDWKFELMSEYRPNEVLDPSEVLPKFAKFERNDSSRHYKNPERDGNLDRTIRLTNSKIKMVVRLGLTFWRAHNQNRMKFTSVEGAKISVNDVELTPSLAVRVYEGYASIKDGLAEAERVAREAKRAMELNERKWNLVESLQGLTRNEQGALVPECKQIVTAPSPTETASTSSSTVRAKRSKRTAPSDDLLAPLPV